MTLINKQVFIFLLVLGLSQTVPAITIKVKANKSCQHVVGLGFSTSIINYTGKAVTKIKNFGGVGRSYTKSGMPSGNTFNFGFAQGNVLNRKNRSCGQLVLNHSAEITLKCSVDNQCVSHKDA